MKLVVSREGVCSHEGSMRCERCFPQIVEMKRDGACILEQTDDGQEFLTLVVIDENRERTYVLTEEQFAPFAGENCGAIFEGIADFEVTSD